MPGLVFFGFYSLVNSSTMADDAPAAAAPAAATRPEKPDEAAFNQEHAKLEKELAEIKNKSVCCLAQLSPHRQSKNPQQFKGAFILTLDKRTASYPEEARTHQERQEPPSR